MKLRDFFLLFLFFALVTETQLNPKVNPNVKNDRLSLVLSIFRPCPFIYNSQLCQCQLKVHNLNPCLIQHLQYQILNLISVNYPIHISWNRLAVSMSIVTTKL
jgi:hypothetical protein